MSGTTQPKTEWESSSTTLVNKGKKKVAGSLWRGHKDPLRLSRREWASRYPVGKGASTSSKR
jgi:hypothetical protein